MLEKNRDKFLSQNISFCKVVTQEIYADIWDFINNDVIRGIIPYFHEENVIQGLLNRKNWKSAIPDFSPVYLGMVFDVETNTYFDPCFSPTLMNIDKEGFLTMTEKYFRQFKDKHIAVQLSGGLDSSIIIGLLRHFNIPFSMVGMTSKRFEFRTEHYIQKLLAEGSEKAILIDYEKHLPFFNLYDVPAHQYPDLSSSNYGSDLAMAKKCKELGVEILFSGFGGDVLFATGIPQNANECNWKPQVFVDTWVAGIAYKPYNVDLVPFYAAPEIMNAIYNLRRGMPEDIQKRWARTFFKDVLPNELVNYTYCADFWGLYIDGLLKALPEIEKMHKLAHEITGLDYFSDEKFKEIMKLDLLNCKKELYQPIEARISLVTWINSLYLAGLLN
jgi:hypothetical protein